MHILTNLLWLGPCGLILFLASTICLLIAIIKHSGPSLIYLAVGWLLLGLAVIGAAMEINGIVQFIQTKQSSPQYTPVSMLLHIWRATVIAVTTISLMSLPVLIKGLLSVSDGRQRHIYTLAALAAISFICANIISVILIDKVGEYPYSPTINEAEQAAAPYDAPRRVAGDP